MAEQDKVRDLDKVRATLYDVALDEKVMPRDRVAACKALLVDNKEKDKRNIGTQLDLTLDQVRLMLESKDDTTDDLTVQ